MIILDLMATVTKQQTTVGPTTVTETVTTVQASAYVPEKELLRWTAPARPFKRRTREFWVTVTAIAALLSFILFLAEGVMPVILIVSLVFLFYVMSTVPPNELEYLITNKGVKIIDKTTEWAFMNRFWFDKRMDSDLAVIELNKFPGRMELVAMPKDVEKIRATLAKYMPEDKPKQTSIDKAVEWAAKKLPQN